MQLLNAGGQNGKSGVWIAGRLAVSAEVRFSLLAEVETNKDRLYRDRYG